MINRRDGYPMCEHENCNEKSHHKVNGKFLCKRHYHSHRRKVKTCLTNKPNSYTINGDYATIHLNNNQSVIVDAKFLDIILKYRWSIGNHGYAINYSNMILLHNLITNNINLEYTIDHLDQNKLDCRLQNLRVTNRSVNAINKNLISTNTSGYVGVSWCKDREKWQVHIKVNSKSISLGRYTNLEDAVNARMNGEIKYFGEIISPTLK